MQPGRSLRLGGAITALATPFRNGRIDGPAFEALAEWQILSGVDGLAVATVTGEGPTLSPKERASLIEAAVRVAAGRVPILAATGTNATESTIVLTRAAAACGAAAALVTVPYYSKPGRKGIVHHFEQVGDAAGLPLIVENAPGRTASDLTAETLGRLTAIPAVVGICDATGNIGRFAGLQPFLRQRFRFLSGHDGTALAFGIAGGSGVISPAANVLPRLFASMQQAAQAGNLPAALALRDRLLPLVRALGPEGDPAHIKYALHLLRGISPELRLPLVRPEPEERLAIGEALAPFHCQDAARRVLSL
ncbi:4-hydroxy-tetrahydrodipicolinate synthase [Rhizobium binxianense]